MQELLTVTEVAPMVRMSDQALYRAIREKQFPAIRIGAQIRIPESALTEWVEAQLSINAKKPTITRRGVKEDELPK